MIAALTWIGRHAQWALIVGVATALALPDLAAFLSPTLPTLVAVTFGLAMLRVDLAAVARRLTDPRRALPRLATALTMTAGAATLGFWACRALGVDAGIEKAVVFALLAPPIGSAAALCLLMGLNAGIALELTLLCSLLTPVAAPVMAEALLGAGLTVSPLALGLRTAAMIGAGLAIALGLRRILGAGFAVRRKAALDGASALAMIAFAFPIFDGLGALIADAPIRALWLLGLSALLLLGPQIASMPMAGGAFGLAVGFTLGMRSVAVFLAALPDDQDFALFVALYQFPMYATPLLLGALYRRMLR